MEEIAVAVPTRVGDVESFPLAEPAPAGTEAAVAPLGIHDVDGRTSSFGVQSAAAPEVSQGLDDNGEAASFATQAAAETDAPRAILGVDDEAGGSASFAA